MIASCGCLYLTKIANVIELWNSDGTGTEILRACMSYKRFFFLLHTVRFDNKNTRGNKRKTDKLAAIRSFLDAFILNCTNNVGTFATIDEKL
jgi:hypothetical protein